MTSNLRPSGSVAALLASCHPEPALAVTTLATALAAGSGRGRSSLWVLGAIGSGQLYVGWSNDYLDRERDARYARPDKPLAVGTIEPRLVGAAALIALPVALALTLRSGIRATAAHGVALAAATSYNLGIKSTPFSVLPYALGFGALPEVVGYGLPGSRTVPRWALLAGALLGSGGHFAQVLGDIESDRGEGRLGLPQRLGARWSAVAGAVLMAGAGAVVAGAAPPRGRSRVGLVATSALAAGVLVTGLTDHPRAAFRLTLLTAAATVATLVAGEVSRSPELKSWSAQ
ncbi:MAG: UbiA family prenyltransferase [Candidatus Dormibacteraceae bacterium]